MVKIIGTTGAAKDAGRRNTLAVPVRGRPAVHPTLEDSGSHRNFTSSEDAEGILKAHKVAAINQVRIE